MRRRQERRPSAICYLLPSRAATGPHDRPRRNHAPSGALVVFIDTRTAYGAGGPVAPTPPPMSMGRSVTFHGPNETSRYHPQDAALGQATWSVGHYGEVFGVTAPEAYVPRMMYQEYTPEDDPDSFLGEGWEEEVLEVEAFQEPTGNHNDRACNNNYRVPLISQEQPYANHGLQVNQVTTSADDPGAAAPLPPGETRAKPGVTRR